MKNVETNGLKCSKEELVKQEYGVDMPIRTVGEYLKRWGFTVQKSVKVAYKRDPVKVARWLQEEYPAIRDSAKAEDAEIYTGATRSDSPAAMRVAASTTAGWCAGGIYDGMVDVDRFQEFLEALVKDIGRKAFLILDNLRVHHAKAL